MCLSEIGVQIARQFPIGISRPERFPTGWNFFFFFFFESVFLRFWTECLFIAVARIEFNTRTMKKMRERRTKRKERIVNWRKWHQLTLNCCLDTFGQVLELCFALYASSTRITRLQSFSFFYIYCFDLLSICPRSTRSLMTSYNRKLSGTNA